MRLLALTLPLTLVPLALAATGGPDDGGMVYTDSDEADGPGHAWLDASGGTAYDLDDDETVAIDLPFTYSFYGTDETSASIANNGVLFFSGASPLSTGICPDASTTWSGIAAYWDDLAASTVHTETFGTYPWRTFVVSWDEASHATAGGSGQFQVWLMEGRGEAVVVLDDTTWGNALYDDGATATVGTNGTTAGLAWSCNTTFSSGTSIWFGDEDSRPDRAEIVTDSLPDDPWHGITDFDYTGRSLGSGDVNGDGIDDLLIGTQDRGAGVVSLIYRPDVPGPVDNADAVFTGDTTDDDFGTAVIVADLDGDGSGEILVGAPGNDDAANRAGAVYVFEGLRWSGDADTGDAEAIYRGANSTAAAGSSLAAGDVDGDGYTDFVVGAPTDDTASTDSGTVVLVYGTGAVPTGTHGLASEVPFTGNLASDQLGGRVAIGDLDGDGAAEIVTSAMYADDGATNAGTVYVVAGGTYSGVNGIGTAASCAFSTPGSSARLGASLLVADIDGTGILDLLVSGTTEDGSYTDGGKTYVFYDPDTTCPGSVSGADATISGAGTSANLGSSLAAGDLDGDGMNDLVIGAANAALAATGGGAAYVFTTAPSGSVSATTADHTIEGSTSAAALGTALAITDNASGVPTLYAAAPYDSFLYSSEGSVYQWTWTPDFLDDDADGFVAIDAGGNDCDDTDADAYPGGTDTDGDSVDGDCDGWTDGVVKVREDADEFAWDLENEVGGRSTDTYDFESLTAGATITTYGDLTFTGDIAVATRIYGTRPADLQGARVATGSSNSVTIDFGSAIDALSVHVLDPEDSFTLTATGDSGTVVSGYTFDLSGDDRPEGVYRGFTFSEEVTSITLTGASTDGFGIDDLEVAFADDSDRDGDGWTDADGDCDDGDAAVNPDEVEDLGNGVDDDCDGVIDAGNADAYSDLTSWEAAAGLDLTETVDFEILSSGEAVTTQYTDVGVLFDGGAIGLGSIDGTPAHDTRAGLVTASTVTLTFDEDQPAIGLYLLDGDTTVTVYAYDDGVLYYTTTVTPSSSNAFYGLVFDLTVDEVVITSTDSYGIDDVMFSALGLDDADGDGQTEREGDCDDTDATAYTGAAETWYDGVDGDCLGGDDYDADEDGSEYPTDCDDTEPTTNPDATETYYDGVDANCDGLSDYDADGDGHDDISFGGDDCDDGDDTVSPDATETWYDGVDQDCDNANDYDADGDGFTLDGTLGGFDCDDSDAAISPDAIEVWYDGIDQDCAGETVSDYDADGDGHDATAWGGDDCEDEEPLAYPGASGEACYDGVDTDCDGADDYDCDADGYSSEDWGGDDCDDADSGINPGATDTVGDGIDTNCDDAPDYDYDADGYDGEAYGGDDCDDTDASVNPGATDTCYDGEDTDCDTLDDYDCDQDGYTSDVFGGDDCDDDLGSTNPGARDFPYDGVDSDCDGGSEYDLDGDGATSLFYGGTDCDDTDADTYVGAPDACYDGVDSDCGGEDDDDCDGDGYAAEGTGGEDCDDGDAAINPAATEVAGDGVDQDCDGSDLETCSDCDGDGFDSSTDCDDTDADVYPGATDAWYDGVDSDCDGANDYDADRDGASASAWGGADCDDADAGKSPSNTEDPCGSGDEDCDGETDEDCEVDTSVDDTGTEPYDTAHDTAPETRDTADDWRPGSDKWENADEVPRGTRCGCDTPDGAPAALGLAAAMVALGRRRR